MAWVSEGIITQPLAGMVLADTGGVVTAVRITPSVFTWATRTAHLVLAQRDAVNLNDIEFQRFDCDPGSNHMDFNSISLAINERLVVRAQADVDGDIQVSIIF